MPAAYFSVQSTVLDSDWTRILSDRTTSQTLSVSGWAWKWDATQQINSAATSSAGSGDAAWVLADAFFSGCYSTTTVFSGGRFTGLDTAKTYKILATGSNTTPNRSVDFRVNGGTAQNVLTHDGTGANTTESAIFLDIAPSADGEITLEFAQGAGSAYFSAAGIEEVAAAPTPNVTTTDTLQPGTEFTLTATNYASAPVSPVTLTDTEGSTITVAVTISGSGPYTAVGTMPTIAEAVTAGTSLLFGDVTIELTT